MNKKIIIIYKSSTRFTKKYAEYIAEELNCQTADFKAVTPELLAGFDCIIFGSRAHAGKIDGYEKAKKFFQAKPFRQRTAKTPTLLYAKRFML